MLLPRKWVLSLGLLATAPGIVLAGPFDGKSKSSNARPIASRPSASRPSAKPASAAQRSNEEIAQDIARGMKAAALKGKGIQIEMLDGVATLTGQIKNAEQLAKATQVASRVPGVESVDNRLTTVAASASVRHASREPIQQVQYEAEQLPEQLPEQQLEQQPEQQPQEPPVAPAATSNQQVAQGIADQMAAAGLNGYDIEIRFKNGVCSLSGGVSNVAEAQRAQEAAQSVSGVQQVNNGLTVNGRPVAQPAPQMARHPAYPNGLAVGEGQLPPGLPPQAMGNNAQIQQMQMQQMRIQQMQMQQMQMQPGGPGMGGVAPAGGHMMHNQPDVPEYAWPTYAQNDNYAAVTYPNQYDASAFPYIGPFYPYPQVPLNWRQSTLEWKDGTWNLRFSTKTDKWFWFVHPKNWD